MSSSTHELPTSSEQRPQAVSEASGAVEHPILSFVVPCYNSEDYMARCIDSLLVHERAAVEIIIVNDGSTDRTAQIADSYEAACPGKIRVIHQRNGGHGAAINSGLRAASGSYLKVVDSDDWLDPDALARVLELLDSSLTRGSSLDLLVTNFVYEKEGKRNRRTVNFTRTLPVDRTLGWGETGSFRPWQYLLMHSIIYRTDLLRACGLTIPEHSFYVDNYFAFVPLTHVRTLRYADVDLYRYHIGRADQSVNERVMITRIDQQIAINRLLIEHLSEQRRLGRLAPSLDQYMMRFVTLITTVSSVLLERHGTAQTREKKRALWDFVAATDPQLYNEMRSSALGSVVSRTDPFASLAMRGGYHAARVLVGFN